MNTVNPKNVVGSIAYYDGTTINFALKDDFSLEMGTPIGVVVIPNSHTDDGKCRIVSLVNMLHLTPEKGTIKEEDASLKWGVYNDKFTTYEGVINIEGDTSNSIGYLPFDIYSESPSELKYAPEIIPNNERVLFSPPPYNLHDGSKNSLYYIKGQALSDMKGKSNTEYIVSLSPIKNQANGSFENECENYPAAMVCQMYHTEGTKSGDWYLPSIGELGYLFVKIGKINNTLESLGLNAIKHRFQDDLWSSTYANSHDDSGAIWILRSWCGGLYQALNYGLAKVRAFMIV